MGSFESRRISKGGKVGRWEEGERFSWARLQGWQQELILLKKMSSSFPTVCMATTRWCELRVEALQYGVREARKGTTAG